MTKPNRMICWIIGSIVMISVGITTAVHGEDLFPSAFLPENVYTFDPVVEGTEVVHNFVLQNKGKAPLIIHNIRSG